MSSEAVHKACEFGANANDRIGIAWPSNEWSNLLASISNMFTKPSIEPHAKYLPSGLLIVQYLTNKKTSRITITEIYWKKRVYISNTHCEFSFCVHLKVTLFFACLNVEYVYFTRVATRCYVFAIGWKRNSPCISLIVRIRI